MNRFTKGEYVKVKQFPTIEKRLITSICADKRTINVISGLNNETVYAKHELVPYMFSNFHAQVLGLGSTDFSSSTTMELVMYLKKMKYSRNTAYQLYQRCLIDLDTENARCFLHCWNSCGIYYEVKLLREKITIESCSVCVVAKSKNEAKELALNMADSMQYTMIRMDSAHVVLSVE